MSIPVRFADSPASTGTRCGSPRSTSSRRLLAYLLARTWRGGDWLRAAGWAGAGLLLATAWLLPWYLIWPLPLAPSPRPHLTSSLLALTAFQLGTRIPL